MERNAILAQGLVPSSDGFIWFALAEEDTYRARTKGYMFQCNVDVGQSLHAAGVDSVFLPGGLFVVYEPSRVAIAEHYPVDLAHRPVQSQTTSEQAGVLISVTPGKLAFSKRCHVMNNSSQAVWVAVSGDPNATRLTSLQLGGQGGMDSAGANIGLAWQFAKEAPVQKLAVQPLQKQHVSVATSRSYITVASPAGHGMFAVWAQNVQLGKGDTLTVSDCPGAPSLGTASGF
eukprot:m51a1_g1290 hypothetical protein (231) ;mRNA; f:173634-174465